MRAIDALFSHRRGQTSWSVRRRKGSFHSAALSSPVGADGRYPPYACCGAYAGIGDAYDTGGAFGVSAIGSLGGELTGPSYGFGRDASDLFGGVLQDVLLVIVQVGCDDGLGEFASADPGPYAISQLLAAPTSRSADAARGESTRSRARDGPSRAVGLGQAGRCVAHSCVADPKHWTLGAGVDQAAALTAAAMPMLYTPIPLSVRFMP